MFLDLLPGGRKKQVSRSQVQKIKKGGQIADAIRQVSNRHHSESDVPRAEEHLTEAIENWPRQKNRGKEATSRNSSLLPPHKEGYRGGTWWKRVIQFFVSK